jgi:hypothetical protein
VKVSQRDSSERSYRLHTGRTEVMQRSIMDKYEVYFRASMSGQPEEQLREVVQAAHR